MTAQPGAETALPPSAPVRALVLAGSRPGSDPLLEGTRLSTKALLPIAGRPMLAHVLEALERSAVIGDVTVVAQDTLPLTADTAIAPGSACWRDSPGTIADAVEAALREGCGPLLVTTADNVLLTPAMLSQFVADAGDADVAVGLVERRQVAAAGYSTQRTWLRFRRGAWSGANLFLLSGPRTLPLVEFWRGMEQDRKKGLKILGAFGPGLLAAAVLRLIDIQGFARRAARRFGLRGTVVPMKAAEACIDADKPADLPVIEAILAARTS